MSHRRVLMIGIGNPIRRDDGVGSVFVEEFATDRSSLVSAMSVHQLTPDLAVDIVPYDVVLFVDAAAPGLLSEPRLSRVEPAVVESPVSLGHHLTPSQLLAIAQSCCDAVLSAWLLAIPSEDMSHGEGLSGFAVSQKDRAMAQAEEWLNSVAGGPFRTKAFSDP